MDWSKIVLKKIPLGKDENIAEKIKSKIKNILEVETSPEQNIAEKIKNKMKNILELKAPPEPLQFSGDMKSNWRKFRQQFEEFLTNHENEQKSPLERVSLLLSVIGEDGLYLYNTFDLDDNVRSNISLVLACIETHCKKKRNIVRERYLFQKIIKKSDEDFETFLKDIRFKIKSCNYGAQENSILRDRVVSGVNDISLTEKLIENEVKLEEAIDMCRAYYGIKEYPQNSFKEDTCRITGSQNSFSDYLPPGTKSVMSLSEVITMPSDSDAENSNSKISFIVGNSENFTDSIPERTK